MTENEKMLKEAIEYIPKFVEEMIEGWEMPMERPNQWSLDRSVELVEWLDEKRYKPYYISPTVEEGMCFCFKINEYIMHLEIYNDGDVGYITSSDKKKETYENDDVQFSEVMSVVDTFFTKYKEK